MKITNIFSVLFFLNLSLVFGQQKLVLEKGEVTFTSNAELEIIKAYSKSIKGIVDISSNQFAIKIPIKSFSGFQSDVQRTHFNENYLESEKYPNATFSGKIIEPVDFNIDGNYEVRAKGDLDIHGIKQTRIIKIKILIKNEIIAIGTKFTVPLTDHNIQIPKIINQKLASEIDVVFTGTMKFQK